MASGSGGKPKLLFVTSKDFGELTNAVYFTLGQDFESRFLVPPTLYQVNQGGLPVPTQPYRTIDDILATVDRDPPDIVFLFSGYLYANNGLFSIDDLERLIGALRQRGCRMVTSDPFVGVLARVDANSFNLEPAVKKLVVANFTWVHDILKSLPHLYLVDMRKFATTETLAFSNPSFFQSPTFAPLAREVQQILGLDPARKRWVFVLAAEDYKQYTGGDDTARFNDLLTDQFYEVLQQGRQPVLIGPETCTSAVALRSYPSDGFVLLPFCRHDWFMSLILEAEYTFSWNIFSNSVLIRTMNRLPVFFFDPGHMARGCTPLFHRGLQGYYVGGEPSYLNFNEPLDANRLAIWTVEQERARSAMADNLLKSPAPTAVVRELMRRSLG